MSFSSGGAFFSQFLPSILSDLKRIASGARGETSVEELQAEAWIVAVELDQQGEAPQDLMSKLFRREVVSRLYNRFVKFAEKQMRHAFRLDAEREGDDGELVQNGVLSRLQASEQNEPEVALAHREDEVEREDFLLGRFSEAVAYVRIFSRSGQTRQAVSDRLAIATCTLRRRLAKAEIMVKVQPSLFDGIVAIPPDFVPAAASAKPPSMTQKQRDDARRRFRIRHGLLFPRAMIPVRAVVESFNRIRGVTASVT